jgi:parallel beta-helix repeat protein
MLFILYYIGYVNVIGMPKKIAFIIIFFLLLLAISASPVKPIKADLQIINVLPGESIQEAINSANAGDVIFVQSATYSENVIINKSLSLIGENPLTTFIDGGGQGNVLTISSSNVVVKNFTIQNGGFSELNAGSSIQVGTPVTNVVNASICYNIIKTSYYGLRLFNSNNNKIMYNYIANNSAFGIDFSGNSSSNSVIGNTIVNHPTGIFLQTSILNIFYHNNFINNTHIQVFASACWDNGYPSGGNYWSDYDGVDEKSGPDQNEAGSDGIGDTVYSEVNDRYPLMGPFATFYVGSWDGVSYNVDVVSNSTEISNFYFSSVETHIRFNVTGNGGTSGFCRVAVPRNLLWVEEGFNWAIYINDEPITNYVKIIEKESYTYIYFVYSYSTITVKIKGTHAIPEMLAINFLIFSITILIFVKVTKKLAKMFERNV